MRWLFGGATALFLLWAAYVASPYIALLGLASSVVSADVPQISERINLRAIRQSLAKQVVGEAVASRGGAGLGGSEADLAKATIAMAADPFLDRIVTEPGIAGLLADTGLRSMGGAGALDRLAKAPRQVLALATVSRWRGFRNVYFTLPPGVAAPEQVRLQLRLSRLSWRLVGIDLPHAARARLAEAIISTRGSGSD